MDVLCPEPADIQFITISCVYLARRSPQATVGVLRKTGGVLHNDAGMLPMNALISWVNPNRGRRAETSPVFRR